MTLFDTMDAKDIATAKDDDETERFIPSKQNSIASLCNSTIQMVPAASHENGTEGNHASGLQTDHNNQDYHGCPNNIDNPDDISSTGTGAIHDLLIEERFVEGESDGATNTTNGGRRFSLQTLNDEVFLNGKDEEHDTFSSRTNIEKITGLKRKTSSRTKRARKESLEQRLRRTFTIKDRHTSEVTKRIIAITVKYALFCFNFVSWVMAAGAIGTGIWMRTDQNFIVTSDTDFFLDPSIMTCVGGTITFVVAFLGCVGALRENLILLKVFFYVLSIILVGEMVLGIAVVIVYTVPEARETFLRSKPEKILRSAIFKYMDDNSVKDWVDRIQSEFKCCGISHTDEGFRDWQISPYFNCTPSNKSVYRCAVPTSCCIFEKGDRVNIMCGFDLTDKPLLVVRDYIYTRGCIQGFGEWLSKYDHLIIISCLSIFIMQFLAVLSAKLMVLRIEKWRSRWKVLRRVTDTKDATSLSQQS